LNSYITKKKKLYSF